MHPTIRLLAALIVLMSSALSQTKHNPELSNSDYRIIFSGSSYIELEYFPSFTYDQTVKINGADYTIIDFASSYMLNANEANHPALRYRPFAVFLPGAENNSVSIVDYEVSETKNFRLAPVPYYVSSDPRNPKLENTSTVFAADPLSYSSSKYLPQQIAELEPRGKVRDIESGLLKIYPYSYNPAEGIIKRYTRIRLRINFGSTPLKRNMPRLPAEISMLRDAAINSNEALSWTSYTRTGKALNLHSTNSPFASGDWYKIEIHDNGNGNSEGIYKITRSFLTNAGIDVSNIDPRTIKMYGNGGYILPDTPGAAIPDDIQQIPIYIDGEADGHFDPQDYILFYARSIHNWNFDSASNTYSHYISPFSTSNFYWICLNTGGNGMRMLTINSENSPNPFVPQYFTEHFFIEPEVTNLLMEGNLWFSERHAIGVPFIWNVTLTGLVSGSDIISNVKPVSKIVNPYWPAICPYTNDYLTKDELSSMSDYVLHLECVGEPFGAWINTRAGSFTFNASQKTPPNSEQVRLRTVLSSSSPDGESYYDWMELIYKRNFNSAAGDVLIFDSPNRSDVIEYNVSSFSSNSLRVFDVTENNSVYMIQPISPPAQNVRFQRYKAAGKLSRYAVIGPGGYRTPSAISQRVPNQNLHGNIEGADFIIITHPDFLSQAARLKARREAPGVNSVNYLKTIIVTCDQIYDEFSGGVLDPAAIRNFLKFAYENWQRKPSFALLLGDGDIDFKHIFSTNKNWVPPHEVTDPQINQTTGYVNDDYYATFETDGPPQLAIGRIPCKTSTEADGYLDKSECYEDPSGNGYWKDRMIFVADDAITSNGCEGNGHIPESEILTSTYIPPYIEVYKIYLPSYPTVITAQGRRKPDVNTDIINHWNDGCINIHYIGHGSPEVWAHEYILEKDICLSQLHNSCKLPFLSIASCDMSKFDNPFNQSAAELFALTRDRGAIGTLAATRPVYSSGNNALMEIFFSKLYLPRDTMLLPVRFGTAFFQSKTLLHSVNDQKYVLMGDPTLRNDLPRFRTKIDSIAGLSGDTMRALSRIKVFGTVLNPDSTLWLSYNGKVQMKIFDVTRHVVITDECATYNFTMPGGIIYAGSQLINNGKWKMEFIVPKDISYLNQKGRIINYFYNNQADGAGFYNDFYIGGIDPSAPPDTTGPVISLFLNNRNFRTGGIVNNDFELIADLSDESGINTTGTTGHKIDAVLDDNERAKLDLTGYYNSDTTYRTGSLSYRFTGIADGIHSLRLKAWDTYNNSSEQKITFNVMSNAALTITNVYNYPNPFRDNTSFTFEHNYPGTINVTIKIFTVAGRMIKEIHRSGLADKFVMIEWPGKDEDGETLANGVYIYKVMVTSDNGSTETAVGKLAILK